MVMLAQAAVGYTQYFTHLPALLVEVHLLGVTVLVVAMVKSFLVCTYHAPEPIPAVVHQDPVPAGVPATAR